MKKLLTYLRTGAVALLLHGPATVATADDNVVNYVPTINGTVRPRFEMDTENGKQRFEVRNARLSVDGKIAKSIRYYFNTDFCDQGKMKILDVWARVGIVDGLYVQAGQFRMPFGVDPFRGPHTYIFANRSFIGRQICNVRAVGAKVSYTFATLPLTIEGGVFNPKPIGDHTEWNDQMAYAAKATWRINNVSIATGVQSIIPDGIRANLIDGSIAWNYDRWTVEAEYMNKHYTNTAYKTSHGWLAFADYAMPVHWGMFNTLSLQARYDGMTDHSSALRNDDGILITDDPARNRITVGSTLRYAYTRAKFLDIRLNFEKYFYHSGATVPVGNSDKLVAELVLRF